MENIEIGYTYKLTNGSSGYFTALGIEGDRVRGYYGDADSEIRFPKREFIGEVDHIRSRDFKLKQLSASFKKQEPDL